MQITNWKGLTMLYGIDISNWQSGFPLAEASGQLDFAIFKASEYGWGKDKTFDSFAQTACDHGLRFGAYMFARDTSWGSITDQVEFFVQCVGGYIDRAVLVLDWENTNYSSVQGDPGLCLAFLDAIRSRTGKTPLLYTSQSEVRYNDYSAVQAAGYPLWGACYLNRNAGHAGHITDPALPSGGWGAYGGAPLIYQYSSSGTLAGWQLDMNVAYMSESDWDRLAGGKGPEPRPAWPIDEDGFWGPLTTKAIQTQLGSPYIDSIISGQYRPNWEFYPAITSATLEFDGGSGDSWIIKKIQACLGVEQDGVLGPQTIRAWQQRLVEKGYGSIIEPAGGCDGYLGAATATCIQKSVNAESMF